jgi:hypothetical protein
LPEVANQTAADQPIADAAANAQDVQAVPQPAEGAGEQQPAAALPKPVEPAPAPAQPANQTAAAEPENKPADTPTVKVKLKPGTIVKVGNQMVPIPILKRAKP